jgi:hypothetical protein
VDREENKTYFYSLGVAIYGLLFCIAAIGTVLWACVSMPFLWIIVGFWSLPFFFYLAFKALRILVNRSVPVISITKETISINDKSLKVIDLGNITHTEIKVIGNMVGLVIHTQSGETKNTIEIGLNPVAANPEELIAVIQARVKAAKARVAL